VDVARLVQASLGVTAPVLEFLTQSKWAQRQGEPGIADFVVGNPHEMPLPEYVDAVRECLEPRRDDWFAYKMSEPTAQEAIAASLSSRGGAQFEPRDVSLTTGAFAGLAVLLKLLLEPGDEVVFISPPWFFYETLIVGHGGVPVRAKAQPPDFDLPDISGLLTPRTRAVLVNSPNNPTGRVYPPSSLRALATVLTHASARHGRPIYLLSDEAYSRIVFDGRTFVSPTDFYPHSFVVYTYGKTLLTPGQRLGYIAMPASMPLAEREHLRNAITMAQVLTGYAFPNAVLQYALPRLEQLSIDVSALQRRRDRLVSALRSSGYELACPEGTFYLLPKAPIDDDRTFVDQLAEHDVFVLPGSAVELPGYFRISLTATDEMVEQAITIFAALAQGRAGPPPAPVAATASET
jgi:aspartate aminotransferase